MVPGRIATARIQELNEIVAERTGQSLEDATRNSIKDIPLGRYGDVTEMGNAAAFLLSPLHLTLRVKH